MKKMGQKIISLILSFAMVMALCLTIPVTSYANGKDPVTGVKLQGDILSWDPFPGATSYRIHYANNRGSFGVKGATSVNLKEKYRDCGMDLPAGTYKSSGIEAMDKNDNVISSLGAVPDYYYDAYGMTKLDTPKNVRLRTTKWDEHILECDPVPNAKTYAFEARQGSSVVLWSTEWSTPSVVIPVGKEKLFAEGTNYNIRVMAKADGYVSSNTGLGTFPGWYDGLPEINAHIEGDFFYWEKLEGAAKYEFSMSSFGGFVSSSPIDLREELTYFNKPAGTYTFKFHAQDENGIRVSKLWTADYVFDGKAPSKYAVSFESEYGTVPPIQYINKGTAAKKPADPVDNDHQFMYWYNKKGPSTTEYNFSSPINESTVLVAKWYDKIKNVSITPNKKPAEGVKVSEAKGVVPTGSKYNISNQYFISGNTGKTMSSSETFEGGCEYLWVVKYNIPDYSKAVWADISSLNIAVPEGMDLFNTPSIDGKYLNVIYSFRTSGYSSPEIVDATNVTIHTSALNPSGTSGKITVTNTGDRPATVTPSSAASTLFTYSPNDSFELKPGESKDITVTPKSSLLADHYSADIIFTTGSSVQKIAKVVIIVEGEATHEMSLSIKDPKGNETDGTITVKEGYPSTQKSGWALWLKSDDNIDDVEITLIGNGFNIGQVLSDWSPQTPPFDYFADEDLVIAIYPNDGMAEGTYNVTAVISGTEMKTVTADLTFVVAHAHNMQQVYKANPTCVFTGMEEYWHCKKCGKDFRDSEGTDEVSSLIDLAIPCVPHSFWDWVVISEPSHSSAGERYHDCKVCGYKEYDYPPATPCVVSFENNGHGIKPESSEVAYGDSCPYAGTLSDIGWAFLGWYKDPNFEYSYDFSDPVYDDMTIYAKWEQTDIKITKVDIGNVWTMLDPLNTVPFTTEVHDELDTDGINFNDKMEITEECWSSDGVPAITKDAPGVPVVDKTYFYTVTLRAKDGYSFDKDAIGLPFDLIVGGTKLNPMIHTGSVLVGDEGKKVTITFGSIPVAPVTVSAVDISTANVKGITDKTYTGSTITQSPELDIDVNGTNFKLQAGTDYDISYSNNTNVGTARLTISGKGKFTGSISRTFKITKKEGSDTNPGTEPGGPTDPENPTLNGKSIAEVEKVIMEEETENDLQGSTFMGLLPKSTKQTKNSITFTWKKLSGAEKYIIYASKCGKTAKMEKIAETGKNKYVLKKVGGKKLKKGTYYKAIIVAVDKDDKVLSTTITVHAATKGGKVGNYKSVKTKAKKNKVTVKSGKSFKLKGKAVAQSKKLKVKKHVAVRYESDNPNVATVSKKGVIKGVGKGSCYVYAYGQNGVYKKIKVTVK